MKLPNRRWLDITVLWGGAWAVCHDGLWAKGLIALWAAVSLLNYFRISESQRNLFLILRFFLYFSSLCAWGSYFAPRLEPGVISAMWLGMFAYAVGLWSRRPAIGERTVTAPWVSKSHVTCFILMGGGGVLAVHRILGFCFQQPFDRSDWTAITWACLAFLMAYPRNLSLDKDTPKPFFSTSLSLLLAISMTVLVLAFHGWNYQIIKFNLYKGDAFTEHAASKALEYGYIGLGRQGVLLATEYRSQTQGWPSGILYHRRMWQSAGKEELAHAFRQNEKMRNHLFSFTAIYGCQLLLKPDEEAVDLAVSSREQVFWVLTSNGRLLQLSDRGLEFPLQLDRGTAMSVASDSFCMALLSPGGVVTVWRGTHDIQSIPLSGERMWKDVLIDESGSKIWVLDGNGQIDFYEFDWVVKQWLAKGELYPPLWGEPDVARSFFKIASDETFLVLDSAGGIHWRGKTSLSEDHPLFKRLIEYYNPTRLESVCLGYWDSESSVLLMENSGRALLIPIPGLQESARSIEDLDYSIPQEKPIPIQPMLFYEPEKGGWTRTQEASSIATLPEIRTIFELQRDGTLQAILMPQRFFIRLVRGNDLPIQTDFSDGISTR